MRSEPRSAQTPPTPPPESSVNASRAVFQVLATETERLDRFLADQLALSRTQASRLIGMGTVIVNGAPGRAGRRLARGDEVDVRFPAEEPRRTLTPHAIALDIRFEDDHLLVIEKPAGLVVHPAPGHWDDTLVNALAYRGVQLAQAGGERPGIVHRLDRDTSGLLIVAKTERAHRRLSRQLAARLIERRYAALVWGHVGAERTIDAPIARHPHERKRMAVVATGRPAQTHVAPVARFGVCDLVRVRLVTGRTHQIRVHMVHIGHPVVGDRVYGGGGSRRMTGAQRPEAEAVERAAPRQALHAAVLMLTHPETGERLTIRSDWPADLHAALAASAADEDVLARPSVLDYLGFFK